MTMRLLSGIVFSLMVCYSLVAEPLLIRNDESVDRPQVTPTGQFLTIEAPGENNAVDTPRGTVASQLSSSDKVFRWVPSEDTARVTGGAALFDATISADESFLLIGEQVGSGDGPWSSRLIGFNLFNRKLAMGLELPERNLSAMRFLPTGLTLVAVEKAQPQLDHPNRLLLIDLAQGKVTAESVAIDRPVVAVETNNNRCWYTLEGASEFYSLDLHNFQAEPQVAHTLAVGGRLLMSPNGSTMAIYGSDQLEIYDLTTNPPRLLRANPLESGFNPDWGIALSEKLDSILLAETGHAAWIITEKSQRVLVEKCSHSGCYDFSDHRLLLTLATEETIGLFQLPAATEPLMAFSPRRLKPFNRNENFRLFNRSGKEPQALLIDHRGNISIIEINPRRWKKFPIYQVP